jgi:hypothetical protein
MNEYHISLKASIKGIEPYEENDQNILQLRVQLPSGEVVTDPRYRVELALSKDAMLGLGTALIRLACNENSDEGVFHAHPIEKGFASQVLGFYLAPNSCELIVAQKEFGTVEEILDQGR